MGKILKLRFKTTDMEQKANDVLKVCSIYGVYFDEAHGYMAVCKDLSKKEKEMYQLATIKELGD